MYSRIYIIWYLHIHISYYLLVPIDSWGCNHTFLICSSTFLGFWRVKPACWVLKKWPRFHPAENHSQKKHYQEVVSHQKPKSWVRPQNPFNIWWWPFFFLIYPLEMVISHSYVSLPEGRMFPSTKTIQLGWHPPKPRQPPAYSLRAKAARRSRREFVWAEECTPAKVLGCVLKISRWFMDYGLVVWNIFYFPIYWE